MNATQIMGRDAWRRTRIMIQMHTLRHYAKLLGGEIVGDSVLCPGPGRPPDDRSLLVTPPGFTADGTEAEVANAMDRRTANRLGLVKVRP